MIYLIKNNKENAFYMWEDTGAIRETPDGSCFNFFFLHRDSEYLYKCHLSKVGINHQMSHVPFLIALEQ